ncbi:unnamed protein product [Lymnaea stagnalis]|uniref:UDENN domain-containing protein n=1 Tax=Lymnaea stagnalis TaxID=6523 RepID=A0AAV2IIL6_LYMST
MGSRLRDKPKQLFEVFVEIAKSERDDEAPFILQQYPPGFDDKEALTMIPKFAFPCKTEVSTVDHFSFVLTDLDGLFRFGYCRHGTGHQTCLCIVSWLPWYEIFYKLLDLIADITNKSENNNVMTLLEKTYNQDVPAPKLPVTIVANENKQLICMFVFLQQMFSFTTPDPNELPSITSNRNLKEYYSAVDHDNMMKIFASMLHERRIYMTSKKLSRLTACIHAAEALLYPMHWQHLYIPILPSHLIDYISAPMPYLIGVHKNLLEKLTINRVDVGDAVVVDLDSNTVESAYDDLGDLPDDVSNFLKKKLKKDAKHSMMNSGDAISRAFLQAIVRLIGGYRDALKFRPGEAITFDPEAFVQSRSSQSTQLFLEGMLSLQIFQQFIRGRLELLETGRGYTDIFDEEAYRYADKLNNQPKYSKFFNSAKKSGTKSIMKAAPMMSTAVQSITEQGRKAMSGFKTKISGFTEPEEKKGNDFRVSGGLVHSKPLRQTSAYQPSVRATRVNPSMDIPPRPPPPNKSQSRPETTKVHLGEPSHDDSHLRLSYHTPDVSLMGDREIQAAIYRSASAEMLPNHYKEGSSGSCSTQSSDSIEGSEFQFDRFANSDEDSESIRSDQSKPQEPNNTADKLIRPQQDKLIRTSIKSNSSDVQPVPPPRGKRNTKSSPLPSPASSPAIEPRSSIQTPPKPLPRQSSLSKAVKEETTPPKAEVHETPLIKFDSTESETTDSDIFDPLGSPKPKQGETTLVSLEGSDAEDKDSVDMRSWQRNQGSRVSLTRQKAFRRDSPAAPLRSGYKDDDLDIITPRKDSTTEFFDPLSDSNKLDESSDTVGSLAVKMDPLSSHSPRRESSDLLMQEWSVASLTKGPNVILPVGLIPTRISQPSNPFHSRQAYNMPLVHQSLPSNNAFHAQQQARSVSMAHQGQMAPLSSPQHAFQRVSLPVMSTVPHNQNPGKLPTKSYAPYSVPQSSLPLQNRAVGNLSASPHHGGVPVGQTMTPQPLSAKNSPTVSPCASRSSTPAVSSSKQSALFGDLLDIDFGGSQKKPKDSVTEDKPSIDKTPPQQSKWETFD